MNDLSHTGQMQGEMFSPSLDAPFARAVHLTPATRTHTSFIAVQMDDFMMRAARTAIAPVFAVDGTGLIPYCWYEQGLEAPSPRPKIRVVGDVNDFAGLQILMLEVDGKCLRPDGVPYHTIWSHNDATDQMMVDDTRYPWTMRVLDDVPAIDKKTLCLVFSETTKTIFSHRVLNDLEWRAEKLATCVHNAAPSAHQESTTDFDFFRADLDLPYSSRSFNPLRRVEFAGRQRHALAVGW